MTAENGRSVGTGECQHECVCKVLFRSAAYKKALGIIRELIPTTRK